MRFAVISDSDAPELLQVNRDFDSQYFLPIRVSKEITDEADLDVLLRYARSPHLNTQSVLSLLALTEAEYSTLSEQLHADTESALKLHEDLNDLSFGRGIVPSELDEERIR